MLVIMEFDKLSTLLCVPNLIPDENAKSGSIKMKEPKIQWVEWCTSATWISDPLAFVVSNSLY